MWSWLTRGRRTGAPGERAAQETATPGTTGDEEISDEEILERIAERVVSMRMAVPAILLLESSKPLSFVGSQFLVFMEPFVKTFFTSTLYDRFAALMEDRDQYELLIRKIERYEADGPGRSASKKVEKDVG